MTAAEIQLIVLDVDGVLTDGRVTPGPEGEDIKQFAVQDGYAIRLWQDQGRSAAIVSGRKGRIVEQRASELGLEHLLLGVHDKRAGFEKVLKDSGISASRAAYIGDDVPDVPAMRVAGFPVAVANAVPTVKRVAAHVTRRPGGSGAVAEIVERLLRKQHLWPCSTGI